MQQQLFAEKEKFKVMQLAFILNMEQLLTIIKFFLEINVEMLFGDFFLR